MNEFNRLELLLNDSINLLKNKTVLIIGLGGVGGYATEAIARTGISNIIIVDNDTIDITNINRQIIAFNSNVGKYKVDVFYDRIKDINPDCNVIKIKEFITEDNIDLLFNNKIDYLIDACDTIKTKEVIIKKCNELKIKLISSMGTGNKLNPLKFDICELSKTSYDPIAKRLRKFVKDERIKMKVMVVSSTEEAVTNNVKEIPSISFVPGIAGLLCASYVINDMLKVKNE